MKKNLIYLAAILLILSSCSQKPGQVASNFYDAIVNNDLESAKSYCLPSTKDILDKMDKLGVFKRNINKGIFETLEITYSSPDIKEGVTASVNYRVDNVYKNYLNLTYTDGKWLISSVENKIKQIIILPYESSDFVNDLINKKYNKENYIDMVFRLKNLACVNYGEGFSLSKDNTMINANEAQYFKKVTYKLNGNILKKNLKLDGQLFFYLRGISDEDEKKITNAEILPHDIMSDQFADEFDFKNVFEVQGIFTQDSRFNGYSGCLVFENCIIINVKK
jgi:hypothetical protein